MPSNTGVYASIRAPSRRGFFGLLAGAAAAPIVAKLPAPVASPYTWTGASAGYVTTGLSLHEIVAVTLRNRSATIADNLMKPSPLFAYLDRQETVHAG